MTTSRAFLIVAALASMGPGLTRAAAPVVAKGFDAYAIVRTRNIFDPDRVPVFGTYVAPRPRIVAERPRRSAESITLTGVMINGGKALAFFFGSGGDRVLGLNGEIANSRVSGITSASVDLVQNGKKLTVPVGRTLSYDSSVPGGSLTLAAPETYSASEGGSTESGPEAAPAPSDDSSQPPAPLPGNLNEVMKRMMERRQKQLQ